MTPGRSAYTIVAPPEITGAWASVTLAPRITRAEALSVPAVLRARNLIAGSLGALPLHLHAPDRSTVPSSLLDQPENGVPRSVTMAMTYEDLLFEGIAWWRITKFAWTNYPERVVRLEPGHVHVQPDGRVYVDGVWVPDEELIRFDSPNPALLVVGARAIRTCLKLDATAATYADNPMPLDVFTPAEGADPATDSDVQTMLDAWQAARKARASAYVPAAVKREQSMPMTAEQIQLAESRQHAVLEIARLTGVDPEELGVSTTSRSYSNLETDQQKFRAQTLNQYSTAVEERLSMGDVTPRGYYALTAWDAFLRTDTQSRYAAYEVGLRVGAIGEDEVRQLEDKPDLPPSQRPTPAPAAAPALPAQAPGGTTVQQSAAPQRVESFTAEGETVTLSFAPSVLEEFKADPATRTVSGMLLPFGVQTTDGRRIRFAAGSVDWQKAAVSRIKLDREHDLGQLLGSATKVSTSDHGVSASFKVAKTPKGDEALALAADGALDGLSAVVQINDAVPDPANEGGTLVTSARLVRATLTAEPAFDSARLTDVSLSRTANEKQEGTVPEQEQGGTVTAAPDTAAFTAAVEAFTAAVARLGAPQEGREVVPAGRAVGFTVTEPAVYSFEAGRGHSLVRDTWQAKIEGDVEASDRLRKFAAQQREMVQFATVNRTVGANVIPPGYRPDLYVPQLFQGRPLTDMMSKGTLTDATPFTVPKFGSATGATADHVEGTNPTDGTLALATSVTVTPGAISGRFRITREIVDASNPAIDAIALAALKESYSQQTEGKVYAKINGANGVGGTITSGFVPSGAAVVALGVGGTVGSNSDEGVLLLNGLRQQIVEYPFRRFAKPDRLALSQEASKALAAATDTTGRPLLPRIGATNASGTVRTLDLAFDIDGLPGEPAWSITGNTSTDADTFMFNSQDVWVWESNLLMFRFEEVAGPANIDLALFGYFATEILRGSGFSGIRLSVS